ncbi:MAG TPA: uroporphyrinogen decarboxylase family protein, partial [Mesotoga infera]|nr:uroporphyrinogen decarboxylase family protein [Mesotoga infera]
VMCQTGPDSLFVDENIDLESAKKITDSYGVVIGGNIPLTTTMLYGNQKDNMKYVIELLERLGTRNYIVAPGCDMPYNVPVENGIAIQQAIRDVERVKAILKDYEAEEEGVEIDLPDYEHLEKPLIEVFTLDSDTCAACTYMMSVAKLALEEFKDRVDVVEYKFTVRENIQRIKKMGVKNLPSIYINGRLKYSSIIPDRREFFSEIKKILSS